MAKAKAVFRSSVSGKFVKKGYAKAHKNITEKQTVKAKKK